MLLGLSARAFSLSADLTTSSNFVGCKIGKRSKSGAISFEVLEAEAGHAAL
jgi:hypothetical protein